MGHSSNPASRKPPKWLSKTTVRRMDRAAYQAYSDSHRGEFIALPVGSGFAFARCRDSIHFSFYDFHAPDIRPIEEIRHHPILFTLCCSSRHLAKGLWQVIGQQPLEPALTKSPRCVDHVHGSDFIRIYYDGKFWPYAGEDLTKLEPCAVWDNPDQVEDRLRLHFIGRPYPWSERQKVPLEFAERLYREYWAKHCGDGKS